MLTHVIEWMQRHSLCLIHIPSSSRRLVSGSCFSSADSSLSLLSVPLIITIIIMTGTSDSLEPGQPLQAQDEQNIWSSVLKQVQNSANNKLPSNKSVLVLGENEAGKTSLVAKMQGNADPRKGSGLEYQHLIVRDEYRDEQTKLGFWVLDGGDEEVTNKNLLTFALNEENFADTTVLLTASMTAPWDLLTSLQKWANVLEEHVSKLKLPEEKLSFHRSQCVKRFQEYISPGDEIEGLVSSPVKSNELGSPTRELPDSVLSENIGLDIVVVITKTDYMSVLEKQLDFKDEAFDFIQQAIRKFCLRYGAALFYVSAKINKNCDLLYKYLVHRIYGLPFKTPALVVEKDALFIPSGWDSEKKISILYENIQSCSPDDPFTEVIVKPSPLNSSVKDTEIRADDDQTFLLKMQSQLNQSIPSSANTQSPANFRTPPTVKSNDPRRPAGPSPTPSQLDLSKGSPGGEGVLQNFFNSLLNRKSATGVTPPANSPRVGNEMGSRNRVDVAAELDRMAGKQNGSETQSE